MTTKILAYKVTVEDKLVWACQKQIMPLATFDKVSRVINLSAHLHKSLDVNCRRPLKKMQKRMILYVF